MVKASGVPKMSDPLITLLLKALRHERHAAAARGDFGVARKSSGWAENLPTLPPVWRRKSPQPPAIRCGPQAIPAAMTPATHFEKFRPRICFRSASKGYER
jgi:hypothetical protein